MHIDLNQNMQSWCPDPQLESPLFAKLPPEIRHYIFRLALTPLEVYVDDCLKAQRVQDCKRHDFRVRQDHDELGENVQEESPRNGDADRKDSEAGDNLYPENTGPSIYRWMLRPTILATCRRVYAEADSLIYGVERCHDDLHDYLGPRPRYPATYSVNDPYPERPGLLRLPSPTGFWSRQRTEWERRFVRVDYHGRLNGYHSFLANVHYPRIRVTTKRFPWTRIEHVRFCTTHNTWLWDGVGAGDFYASWYPLLKDDEGVARQAGDTPRPWKSLVSLARRHREVKDAQAEQPPPAPGRPGWMPPSADRYPIGSWARDFVNLPRIKSLTMNFHCPQDVKSEYEHVIQFVVDTWRLPLNPNHAGYHYLSAEGIPVSQISWTSLAGPRIFTWTVTWTARVYSGPETYPYGGIVEVDERDYQEEGDSDLDEDEEFPWQQLGLEPPPNDEHGHRRKTKVGNQKA